MASPDVLTARSRLRILAFGDSLTEGYYSYGLRFHPYSLRLQQVLRDRHADATVDQKGASGERVLSTMPKRLTKLLRSAAASGQPYDWVLILGGINDVADEAKPELIVSELAAMYDASVQHGARVLAMTCMEIGFEADVPCIGQERTKLNALIVNEVASRPGVELLDLAVLLPYHSMLVQERQVIWDDHVHLTPAGYDRMADHIYDALQPLLFPR